MALLPMRMYSLVKFWSDSDFLLVMSNINNNIFLFQDLKMNNEPF